MGMMSGLWVIIGKVLSRPAAGDTGLEVRKVCGAVVISVDRIVEVGGCPGTGCGVRRALDRTLGGTASKGRQRQRTPHRRLVGSGQRIAVRAMWDLRNEGRVNEVKCSQGAKDGQDREVSGFGN